MAEENRIGGKHRPPLTNAEKAFLKSALHCEGVLTGDYTLAVVIRHKLGLGPLSAERTDDMPWE